jgi:hypothetical protein
MRLAIGLALLLAALCAGCADLQMPDQQPNDPSPPRISRNIR